MEQEQLLHPFPQGGRPGDSEAAALPETLSPAELELEESARRERPGDEERGSCRLIGQFLHSYLVAQKGAELLVIDQHAAHERVLYHALLSREPDRRSTQLTIPLHLEMPPAWREQFSEIRPFLEEAGFKLELFGDNSYIIREVPFSIRGGREREIHDLLERVFQEEPDPGEEERERVLKTVACHRAVKARQPLDRSEAEQLLRDWEQTPGAAYCPHGRPTVIRFHRDELDKGFHRKGGHT